MFRKEKTKEKEPYRVTGYVDWQMGMALGEFAPLPETLRNAKVGDRYRITITCEVVSTSHDYGCEIDEVGMIVIAENHIERAPNGH